MDRAGSDRRRNDCGARVGIEFPVAEDGSNLSGLPDRSRFESSVDAGLISRDRARRIEVRYTLYAMTLMQSADVPLARRDRRRLVEYGAQLGLSVEEAARIVDAAESQAAAGNSQLDAIAMRMLDEDASTSEAYRVEFSRLRAASWLTAALLIAGAVAGALQ